MEGEKAEEPKIIPGNRKKEAYEAKITDGVLLDFVSEELNRRPRPMDIRVPILISLLRQLNVHKLKDTNAVEAFRKKLSGFPSEWKKDFKPLLQVGLNKDQRQPHITGIRQKIFEKTGIKLELSPEIKTSIRKHAQKMQDAWRHDDDQKQEVRARRHGTGVTEVATLNSLMHAGSLNGSKGLRFISRKHVLEPCEPRLIEFNSQSIIIGSKNIVRTHKDRQAQALLKGRLSKVEQVAVRRAGAEGVKIESTGQGQ